MILSVTEKEDMLILVMVSALTGKWITKLLRKQEMENNEQKTTIYKIAPLTGTHSKITSKYTLYSQDLLALETANPFSKQTGILGKFDLM